ncbi:hypothetical protein DRN74_04490 [Candidatus Micrarchaeota archaeon]|nr:MAG: hypothetical protein DRN74_04490 [Candidatus Micrarchaeota archaeon]
MLNIDLVEKLKSFGFTEYQAKALSVLFERSESTAKDISKYGGIPETKVYAVLDSLDDMGFVKQTLGRPKRYKAMDIVEIINKMISKHREMIRDLENRKQETIGLVKKLLKETSVNGVTKKNYYIIGENPVFRELARHIVDAESHVYIIGGTATYKKGIRSIELVRTLNEKLRGGIEVRLIIPKNLELSDEELNKFLPLLSWPNTLVKMLPNSGTTFAVIDNKAVGFALSEGNQIYSVNVVRDPDIVRNFEDYFIRLWNKAEEASTELFTPKKAYGHQLA